MNFLSKLLPALCVISVISVTNATEQIIEGFRTKRPVLTNLPIVFVDTAINLEVEAPIELMNKRYNTFEDNTVIEHAGTGNLTVVTNFNKDARYQLESKRILVDAEDKLLIPYKIVVYPGGKASLGLLNTNRDGWYDNELILEPGIHQGIYKRKVPQGQIETSLVFRNYHLNNPGSSTFTIERIGINKKSSLLLLARDWFNGFQNQPLDWKNETSIISPINQDGSQTIITSPTEKSYQIKFTINTNKAKKIVMPLRIFIHSATIGCGFLNNDESKFIWQNSFDPGQHDTLIQVPINEKKVSFVIYDHNSIGTSSTFTLQKLQVLL